MFICTISLLLKNLHNKKATSSLRKQNKQVLFVKGRESDNE